LHDEFRQPLAPQRLLSSKGHNAMTTAKIIAVIGLLAMTAIILYAFVVGDFNQEGAQLLAMPWGQVSMVDLYVGFILFSCWIVYREKSLARSAVWVVLMMLLGNWTASLYALVALLTSGGDWKHFWLGRNA
jgi:hypothetical protein